MKRGFVLITIGLLVMVAHVGLLPMIYLVVEKPTMTQRHDIAFVIGPLTAAYFVTIVKFAVDNQKNDLFIEGDKVNMFFLVASFLVIVPFVAAIYYLIYLMDSSDYEIDNLKRGVGVIELFLGASFTMFIDSLFGKST
jgi:hypothetical protein